MWLRHCVMEFLTHGVMIFWGFADVTRSELVKLCLEGVTVDPKLDTNQIADKMKGYTGSDITNVCR